MMGDRIWFPKPFSPGCPASSTEPRKVTLIRLLRRPSTALGESSLLWSVPFFPQAIRTSFEEKGSFVLQVMVSGDAPIANVSFNVRDRRYTNPSLAGIGRYVYEMTAKANGHPIGSPVIFVGSLFPRQVQPTTYSITPKKDGITTCWIEFRASTGDVLETLDVKPGQDWGWQYRIKVVSARRRDGEKVLMDGDWTKDDPAGSQ
jgi:hypothetical protein